MPAQRQQRRNNARGNPGFKRIATAGALVAEIASQTSNTIVLTFGAIAPTITLNGVPAILRSLDSTLPTSAGWAAPHLILQYASPNIGTSEDFVIPNKDPAFRGASGEYIAAATLTTEPPSPTPAAITFTSGSPATIGNTMVPNTDNALLDSAIAGATGDKYTVAVPSSFALGCSISGVSSGSPVAAGAVVTFEFDGSTWHP